MTIKCHSRFNSGIVVFRIVGLMREKITNNSLLGLQCRAKNILLTVFLSLTLLAAIPNRELCALDDDGSPFLPTWKLLTDEAKRQFVAGYLHGWSDAAKVTDIAIDYVRGNPDEALDGLKRLKQLYNISGVQAELLSEGITQFYADPENAGAPLSKAVTAARNRVIRGEIR